MLYFPGGSRPLAYLSIYCGDNETNNHAEYVGIVAGMIMASAFGIKKLKGRADSKLCVNQISGEWKCKAQNLKGLLEIARDMQRQFTTCSWHWIPRAENTTADQYANTAMDGQGHNDFVRVAPYEEGEESHNSNDDADDADDAGDRRGSKRRKLNNNKSQNFTM